MLPWLRRQIRNVFGFSAKEVSGVLILSFILFGLILFLEVYKRLPAPLKDTATADQQLLDSLMANLKPKREDFLQTQEKFASFSDSPFDPNASTKEDLIKRGIPASIAQRIVNYRSKGGRFNSKQDLKKIYGFPDSLYMHLESFILLPDAMESTYQASSSNDVKSRILSNEKKATDFAGRNVLTSFDINLADSVQLVKIKGIGPVLASRILKFKEKLGGFAIINQVADVYGLPEETFQELISYAYVGQNYQVKQISLNKVTIDELSAHPYISRKHAAMILAYRQQHGDFQSLEDLDKLHAVEKEVISKIKPYLVIE